jgi:cell division protein FtsI (penicillin-binding protein 3)
MSIKSEILLRVRIAFVGLVLLATAIVLRLLYVQIGLGSYWKEQQRRFATELKAVKATRGNIFASDGSLLATSIPRYRLALDPMVIRDEKAFRDSIRMVSDYLARHFRTRTAQEYFQFIMDARKSGKRYIFLSRDLISYSDKKAMQQWPLFRQGRYKGGVVFEKIDERYRPFRYLAQRSVGFINQDNRGAGLEYSFNAQLAGKDGQALFQRITQNVWKPIYNGEDIKPEPGLDVYTTLDINLQDVAETALLEALIEHDANYGCVVLMEVKTGEIKVMANLGKTGEGRYSETYNYAIGPQGLTDPGSTMKLASLMALLEETSLELGDSVNAGDGLIRYGDAELRDTKEGGYGRISIQQAFEYSSNVAFLKLMTTHFGDKPQKFIDYIRHFGLAAPLGFQMAGTAVPYIKNASDPTWSKISLPWIAVGYESKMSPMQMLTFYNAVANKGKMVSPVIVKEVRRADQVLERYQTTVLRENICSKKTLEKVTQCLIGVVERGTARNIRTSDYHIARSEHRKKSRREGIHRTIILLL